MLINTLTTFRLLLSGLVTMTFLLGMAACGSNAASDDAAANRTQHVGLTQKNSDSTGQAATTTSHSKEHDVDVFGSFPQPVIDLDQKGVTKAEVVFAGGCFWCTEAVFEQLKGVSDVVSGYAGGKAETANYNAVGSGNTGHAEVIRITYNPSQLSYGQLLRVFFATHDPTQLNRQGNDIGTQYRSAIFFHNEDEKRVAEAYIKQLDAADALYPKPIVTTLEPLTQFHEAELYHQDYARQNPDQPYIKFHALPLADKVDKLFPELKSK